MLAVQVQVLMVVTVVSIAILRTEIVIIVGSTLADGTSRIELENLHVVLNLLACLIAGRIAIIEIGEMLTFGVNKVTHQNLGECEGGIVLNETLHLHVAEEEHERTLAVLASPVDNALGTLTGEELQEI